MKHFIFISLSLFYLIGCYDPNQRKGKTGETLARTYCGSCHLFPRPALIDKRTWKEDVLPSMARQLGIDYLYETVLPGRNAAVTVDEWQKILIYYMSNAPATMPAQQRPVVKAFTTRFTAKKLDVAGDNIPSTSFIKIDQGNHWIYAANSFDSSLNIYNERLKIVSHNVINATIVDIDFDQSLLQAGKRSGTLTNIGIMNPNDRKTGTADGFALDIKGNLIYTGRLFDTLPRPVQTTRQDFDKDGRADYLICGFGNSSGALFWMKSGVGNRFESKVLSPLPGAIKSYVCDFNNDGLPDIISLMAQAKEGIFLYLNKGYGNFDAKELLRFPPINGSSYFEMADFNRDGYQDILYTCGDNGDYSGKVLKYYHGIYIYLNDGKNNFSQQYFFPVHGCYKAVARDFDKDGDLDIAAISYFPDTACQPQESFIYLEQKSFLHFDATSIRDFDEGRWITLDAGDVDGDGYDDIVLGGLVPPLESKMEEWKNSKGKKTAVLLLHNETLHLK